MFLITVDRISPDKMSRFPILFARCEFWFPREWRLMEHNRRPKSGLARRFKVYLTWLATVVLIVAWFGGTSHNTAVIASAHAQGGQPQPEQTSANPRPGAEIFATSCSECHGLDGRGGERAPNIATRPAIRQFSDADLTRIIQQGIT